MLVVLLAGTDPLGFIDSGRPPTAYAGVAAAALATLRGGGGVDELFVLFRDAGYRLEAVDAFVRAAMRWWRLDVPAWRREATLEQAEAFSLV